MLLLPQTLQDGMKPFYTSKILVSDTSLQFFSNRYTLCFLYNTVMLCIEWWRTIPTIVLLQCIWGWLFRIHLTTLHCAHQWMHVIGHYMWPCMLLNVWVLSSHYVFYSAHIASFPGLPCFYLPFAFTIIHGSRRQAENRVLSFCQSSHSV